MKAGSFYFGSAFPIQQAGQSVLAVCLDGFIVCAQTVIVNASEIRAAIWIWNPKPRTRIAFYVMFLLRSDTQLL